ncbi:MAG: phosphoribosylaminoimidazolesuccinocarboxamide synthase [Lentisphaerae bacterium]|nr:phosphoribosylaminoimidazolesuccinocarboxamide synthase [Lentisphaerota bacterium]
MISESRISAELTNVLERTYCASLGHKETGKVRDSYRWGDKRILVATDRISAFDCVLGTIPFKGQVLNQIAAFWFNKTSDIVSNHVINVPDPNIMVVKECRQLPLEFIVRGYITGVTKTSAWYNYQNGVRNFCGNKLPEGLRKDQQLPTPILTPTTKLEKHDRPISRDEAIKEGLIDGDSFDEVADICFRLFARGVEHAASRGLILVDTKYEIGRLDGKFVVSDEVHTPDSSRYWFKDTYEELFKGGKDQRKLDKEYVREWLASQGFRGDGTPPPLPDEIRVEAARRYIQAYELVSGFAFEVIEGSISDRVNAALATLVRQDAAFAVT